MEVIIMDKIIEFYLKTAYTQIMSHMRNTVEVYQTIWKSLQV